MVLPPLLLSGSRYSLFFFCKSRSVDILRRGAAATDHLTDLVFYFLMRISSSPIRTGSFFIKPTSGTVSLQIKKTYEFHFRTDQNNYWECIETLLSLRLDVDCEICKIYVFMSIGYSSVWNLLENFFSLGLFEFSQGFTHCGPNTLFSMSILLLRNYTSHVQPHLYFLFFYLVIVNTFLSLSFTVPLGNINKLPEN